MLNPHAAPFVPGGLAPGAQAPAQAPAQVGAPAQAAPAPPPAAPAAGAVVAYANHFDDKHVLPALTGASAVEKGRTRVGHVKWSTVFRQDYLEGLVLEDADGKGAGNYSMSIACHRTTPDNFQLAQLSDRGVWKPVKLPMFFCKVCYRVAVAGGGTTVTLTHIETDF